MTTPPLTIENLREMLANREQHKAMILDHLAAIEEINNAVAEIVGMLSDLGVVETAPQKTAPARKRRSDGGVPRKNAVIIACDDNAAPDGDAA